ncbi:HAD hydrolase-like protein [Cyanobium sp. BSA11S]|uniref:HAD hydrolase-like protein n=1 Tax=Cyanobium sp. BSA11S TaxID=3108224 RepID=UPI003D81C013
MTSPAACLFDLDGLLLDTEPLHGRAWRQAARIFGFELSDQQLLALRGRRRLDNAGSVIAWIEAAGGTPPTPSSCWRCSSRSPGSCCPGRGPCQGRPSC